MFSEIINTSNLPTLDLHGEICDIARVLINDFISDNIKEKNKVIVIIHGKGSGKIKKITHEVLKENRSVLEYKTSYFNDGMTLVKLNI
ncbi:MAG: Smr/MutS family protein [Bacilli bacterium]